MEQKSTLPNIEQLIRLLFCNRLPLHDEKELQSQLEELFFKASVPFKREYRLDDKNIIDFLVYNNIAVEVKIKTSYSKRATYLQCLRYLKFDSVQGLILLTSRSIGFPKEINNKPCYVFNLSTAWL